MPHVTVTRTKHAQPRKGRIEISVKKNPQEADTDYGHFDYITGILASVPAWLAKGNVTFHPGHSSISVDGWLLDGGGVRLAFKDATCRETFWKLLVSKTEPDTMHVHPGMADGLPVVIYDASLHGDKGLQYDVEM